jgi:AcrR family transcriptional regulator
MGIVDMTERRPDVSEGDGRRTGRPRDPRIAEKVVLAAQRVYTRAGLAGFTFEAIAREAGVGKPAVYRRWASTEDLMADVLRSHRLTPIEAPTGDISAQLIEIAAATLRLMHSEQGSFVLRVSSARDFDRPIFAQYFDHLRDAIHLHNRALLVEAIDRGELTAGTDPDLVLQSLTGAVVVGTLMAMTPNPHQDPAAAKTYCEHLVAQILRGARGATSGIRPGG